MLKCLWRFFLQFQHTLSVLKAFALIVSIAITCCNNANLGIGEIDLGEACVFSSMSITPDNDVLLVDLNASEARGQKAFTVLALCSNGMSIDVTKQVTLTLDNSAIGTIIENTFTSAINIVTKVDFTRVIATYTSSGRLVYGVANLTVVWLRTSGMTTDFFFQLPYLASPQNQSLSLSTKVQSIDSFFAVDTTTSMAPEITQLANSLQNTIIPGVKAAAAKDAQFGVGAVEDFGVDPYGTAGSFQGQLDDQPIVLLQTMTADIMATTNGINKLLNGLKTRGDGNDIPEGQIEALYQLATGSGNVVTNLVNIPPATTGLGGGGFRKGALPVITVITDAIFHTKGEPNQQCIAKFTTGGTAVLKGDYTVSSVVNATHTRAQALTALNSICAKVIGVSALRVNIPGLISDAGGICNASADLIQMAIGTGAVVPPAAWDLLARPANCPAGMCCTGLAGVGEAPNINGQCPLVFKIPQDGSGLGAQVTAGIANVARFGSFTVTTQIDGNPTGDQNEALPPGKTTADFILMITPMDSMPPTAPPVLPGPVISGGSFTMVYPGSTVNFTVTTQNNLVPEAPRPQVFRTTIKILAGGCADLDRREVIILVPPSPPTIG